MWARYAFKLATGAGKTKCMSLAIVWSYFHALREGSEMPRHFVVIAPNLTVFERLKEDFRPEGGGPDIFHDATRSFRPNGRATGISRSSSRTRPAARARVAFSTSPTSTGCSKPAKGAARSRKPTLGRAGGIEGAKPWTPGEELRDRITAHKRIMVLNDEAHHVWDPGSAWNKAIRWLHDDAAQARRRWHHRAARLFGNAEERQRA